MRKKDKISMSVIKRLPRYYRFLSDLKADKATRISSKELSERMGFTASQIRQDLNCFGDFGQQGYGYNIEQLHREIGNILGLHDANRTVIIGAGNLGRAIASHMGFEKRGFNLIGIFDKNEAMSGQLVRGLPVRHIDGLDEFCRENLPSVAVLCIPKNAAAGMVEQLVKLGVKGFWNFSHYDLTAKFPGTVVENVHLGDSLMTLCYGLHALRETKDDSCDALD